MDFLIKEQELDFSETKGLLMDILSGKIQIFYNFTSFKYIYQYLRNFKNYTFILGKIGG